jgi:hypothetical protein
MTGDNSSGNRNAIGNADRKQVCILINGSIVKLNFLTTTTVPVIHDVKHMMLSEEKKCEK